MELAALKVKITQQNMFFIGRKTKEKLTGSTETKQSQGKGSSHGTGDKRQVKSDRKSNSRSEECSAKAL